MSGPVPLPTKNIRVSHLGATVSYHAPKALSATKPTLVLIPGFACGATEFRPQVADAALLEVANLLVLEPLGQGATKTNSPAWTDWDSARCFLQATDALGVKKALVLGHGVGGSVAARMALYGPDKIIGLVIVSTTLGSLAEAVAAGGRDISSGVLGLLRMTAAPNPDFAVPAEAAQSLVHSYLGPDPPAADVQVWTSSIVALASYKADAGRARLRQCVTNLLARDSLRLRLADVGCPVLFVVGSGDEVATEQAVREDAALLPARAQARVEVVAGAFHAPLWTHAAETRALLLDFVAKNNGKGKGQALREAVGMVDI